MVAWWKRLVYSLVSAILGAGVSGAFVAAEQVVSNAHGPLSLMGVSTAVLFFDPWVITMSLPGWFLALPVVLLVRNVRGWRFWLYWAVGICFGPAIILAVAFYSAIRGAAFAGFPEYSMSVVYMAGAISGLTTLFYLLLLRRGQALAVMHADPTVA